MGSCESILNDKPKKKKGTQKNIGTPGFNAPVNNNTQNNFGNTMSQMTLDITETRDRELLFNKKPKMFKYINSYKTKDTQNSLINGTLVDLEQGNSLYRNQKMSNLNGTYNSIYTNNIDETGNMSSYDGIEMIQDGKVDIDMVKKSTDKTTMNNYNEFIGKKNNNLQKNNLINYYNKRKITNKIIDNKDMESSISGIPSGNLNL